MARKKHEPLTIDRMFNSENKGVYSTTSVLSRLFRIILGDLALRYEDYNRLVNQWLDDPTYGVPNDPKRRSTVRGNLNKEIIRPDMSFRVFLKALSCIGTESFKLTLNIKRRNSKKETEHEITVPNLSALVAQYLHDAPSRASTEEIKISQPIGEISLIKEQELDELTSSLEEIEIANATVIAQRKKGYPGIHEFSKSEQSWQQNSPPQ